LSAEAALAQARRWLDGDASVAGPGADTLALAWALKDLCYEAWGTEPPRAARAAAALHELQRAGAPPAQAAELGALAAWTAGIACLTRGQMAEAVQAFDAAATAFAQAGLPDPAAQTQVPKIMALSMLGKHAEAAACAETTQRQLRALGNLRGAARVSQNLGSLQLRRDAYGEAARHYREAAVLFARLGDHHHSVLSDIGMADALAAQGDFDEALRIYARAGMRAGNQALETALALVDESVALVDLARGNYRAALAGLESARRRYEALVMPQMLAIAEKQLGDAYLELRLMPEALSLFDAAVDRFGALELPDEQAWALAQRGRTQALLGQPAARASFAAAAALFQAQGNEVGGAAVALSRAELALSGGDAAQALTSAEQAAVGYGAARQADGLARADILRGHALLALGRVAEAGAVFDATLERAGALLQRQLRLRCLTGQGLVAQAEGQAARAAARFEAAIEGFEDQRRALPGDEIRSAFLGEHLRPYQERLRTALAGGVGAEVLWQLERCRARVLGDRLAVGAAPAAAAADEGALGERLNWLHRRVQRLQEEGESAATLTAELLRTEHALLERARRQRLAAPAQPAGVADAFSVARLQAALQEGDALVAYGVLDDELFACVATRSGVMLQRHLAPWPEVLDALRSLHLQLDTLRHGAAPVRQHLATLAVRAQARLARLHAQVWAPLAGVLQPCARVLVVPHGALAALPFAALPEAGRPLGQSVELALAPSASAALRGLQRRPVPARRVLALGESTRLPHAGREATAVAALFEQGLAFVGERATLAALREHAAAADVLHLACHAQFRADNPRFSALHLVDGLLTVDAAETLGLQACTVVLGACETGLAEVAVGDESVGLVRAFLVAGAARVLASLWPVEDEITAGFMARFHAALVGGDNPAAALRLAQAQTMSEHPHPYFWAAFTLHGGW
jgi:tetratricopeptide (TPR) repeat protein